VRERLVWMVAGAVGIVAVMMLRPETPTAISTFIFIVAYLALSYVTLMLVRHNESNIERLAHMTTIDPLTGAYNRGHLNDVLASEFNRCKRNRQSMVIIMLDIDHFKMLNDDYGHLYGDGVLERVADALTHAAQRAGDYVFRYGGEEFCILSSGMSRTEAFRFADKLRLAVSALEVENRNSPLGHLTASAGVWCVADLNAITQSALLLNVDNALYRAKAAGRNVVVDFADFVVLDETRSEMAEKAAA
jgi:diguanylate cyclase (GGDEF)-like protein